MNKWVKYGIIIAVILVAGIVFYNKVYIPKTTYNTTTPIKGSMKVEVFGIGNVEAKNIYNINSQMGGKILHIYTDINKWVKKNQLLVEIDTVNLPSQIKEAKIAVLKIKKQFQAAKKSIDSLKAKEKLNLINYKRYKKLYKEGYGTKAEYDKAKSDLDSIKAEIASQKINLQAIKDDIKKSKQAIVTLQEKLKRYKIYSPVSGYVISKNGEIAQSVTPTQSILQIVNPKDVWVKTYIDEKLAGNIKLNQKATIKLRSNNQVLVGYVKRIMPKSDLVTLEREIDVAFVKTPIPFYINEQAEVNIQTKILKNVIKIASNKVVFYKGKEGVWIAKNNKAHFLVLNIIAKNDKFVAVTNLPLNTKILVPSSKKRPLKEGMSIRENR